MKNKKKRLIIGLIVLLILIIIFIAILNLIIFIDKKIGIHVFTIVKNDGNTIIAAVDENNNSFVSSLNNVIIKDLDFNEIDKNNVSVGDYIYLYIKNGDYYYCDNTTYYCKVTSIDDKDISIETPGWHYYSFNVDDANIKDINGNTINLEDLKIGETIKVININSKYTFDNAMIYEEFPASTIFNVKSIEIVDNDNKVKEDLEKRNMVAMKKAFVAGVNKDNIYVVDSENSDLLYEVSYAKEGNIGFEVGQEVEIYFNGRTSVIGKNGIMGIKYVEKIENYDKNSNYIIPNSILKKFYTTFDNVEVNIENLTNARITFNVTDKNDLKYSFNNNCTIFKNVAEQPSSEPIISENGSTSISGYQGDKWQELSKISDNIENKADIENIDESTKKISYDWSNIYGFLGSGEYRFVFGDIQTESNYLVIVGNNRENISVKFTLKDNGEISKFEINKGY